MKKIKTIIIVLLLPAIALSQSLMTHIESNTGPGNFSPDRSVPPGTLLWSQPLSCNALSITASHYDASFAFDPECADDFTLVDASPVTTVRWWGGYWNGAYIPGTMNNWNIRIYDNIACLPGNLIHSYTIPIASCNEEFHCNDGTYDYYEYWADISPSFIPSPGVKYWISIQGDLLFPPQVGVATLNPTGCSVAFKSVYFGYPNWVGSSVVFGADYDFAFELYSSQSVPLSPYALIFAGLLIAGAIFFRYRYYA